MAIRRFSVTISYFGLSLSTPNMNGDPYLNCLLFAVMELVAYIGAWLLLKVASRRLIISSTLLVGGAVLLLIQMVPEGNAPSFCLSKTCNLSVL